MDATTIFFLFAKISLAFLQLIEVIIITKMTTYVYLSLNSSGSKPFGVTKSGLNILITDLNTLRAAVKVVILKPLQLTRFETVARTGGFPR